jgi:hypothetical protein
MGDPPPAPPPGPAPVQPDLPTGPGAYTRIVSATPASPEAPGAAPVSEAPAPEPKRGRQNSDWIVLAAILAVVLIGAALLVFFVLRTAEGEPPTP